MSINGRCLTLVAFAFEQIDGSKDRMKELERALLNPHFAQFMYAALDEVNHLPARLH